MEAVEEVGRQILSATGWGEPELEEELERKQAQFAGLLTRDGALELIARERGVEVKKNRAQTSFIRLAEITSFDSPASVKARVWHVFATKKFVKKTAEGSRLGKVRNVLLKDGSGEAMLVLWGRDVDWVDVVGLKRNQVVEVVGAIARKSGMGVELHSNLSTRLNRVEESVELPLYAKKVLSAQEIASSMYDVDFVGKISRVGRQSEFQRVKKNGEVESGSVFDCLLEGGGRQLRLVAWDSNALLLSRAGVGDEVLVEGANTKLGRDGLEVELHAGWASHLVLKKTGLPSIQVKKLGELTEGEEAFVNARITSISNAWALLKCANCGLKTPLAAGEPHSCPCGRERKKLLVARAVVSDESSSLECVFFNQEALDLLGLNVIPLDASAVLELKREEVVGKSFGLLLKAKKSEFTNSLEGVASQVIPGEARTPSENA